MNIVACSLTRSKESCQTKIFNSIEKINKHSDKKIDLKLKLNNKSMGLPEYYNECIDKYSPTCDYMILVHDDVEFINMDLVYQIEEGMKKYDVIGVAGCLNPKISDVNLWHLMADRGDMSGFAAHTWSGTGENMLVTVFGPSPKRVAIIDGVFVVINSKKILQSNTRFDKTFMFHHYDMDFCNTCNINKLKIGTWPILINHSSPGLREFTPEWKQSNENFKNKWKKILQS